MVVRVTTNLPAKQYNGIRMEAISKEIASIIFSDFLNYGFGSPHQTGL